MTEPDPLGKLPAAPNFKRLLSALSGGGVKYVVVGGIAGWVHGSGLSTVDVDVVYDRSSDNLQRLADAAAPLNPYLRGAPPGLPFEFDVPTIERGLNFTLSTDAGPFDLLGEMAGGGTYADLLPHSTEEEFFDGLHRVITLEGLIRAKRAAGRPKDLLHLAILEALAEEREEEESSPVPHPPRQA